MWHSGHRLTAVCPAKEAPQAPLRNRSLRAMPQNDWAQMKNPGCNPGPSRLVGSQNDGRLSLLTRASGTMVQRPPVISRRVGCYRQKECADFCIPCMRTFACLVNHPTLGSGPDSKPLWCCSRQPPTSWLSAGNGDHGRGADGFRNAPLGVLARHHMPSESNQGPRRGTSVVAEPEPYCAPSALAAVPAGFASAPRSRASAR